MNTNTGSYCVHDVNKTLCAQNAVEEMIHVDLPFKLESQEASAGKNKLCGPGVANTTMHLIL